VNYFQQASDDIAWIFTPYQQNINHIEAMVFDADGFLVFITEITV
jgi:hypothetical protein